MIKLKDIFLEADFSFSAQQLQNMPLADFDAATQDNGNPKIAELFRKLTKAINQDYFAGLTEQEVQAFLDAFQDWVMQSKGSMPKLAQMSAPQSEKSKKLIGHVLTSIRPEWFATLSNQDLQSFFQKFEQWIDVLRFQAGKGVPAQNTVNIKQGVGIG